jgi:hypothetical protein
MTFCETSGNNPAHQFAGAGKLIALDKGGQRDRSNRLWINSILDRIAYNHHRWLG